MIWQSLFFDSDLPQAGVDLVQRGGAGAARPLLDLAQRLGAGKRFLYYAY